MSAGFTWVARSDDSAYNTRGKRNFDTEAEAYDDMRDAVLNKMKWNTEYDEDFADGEVWYTVRFKPDEIVHSSYSGVYIYKIVPADKTDVDWDKMFRETKID